LITQNDIDNAASFAEQFRTIILEHYPDWDQYFIPPNLEWQSEGDIAIEVPSRFAPLCPLCIETMWEGIIICWAGWHIHCDAWGGTSSENEFVTKALEIIDSILKEKIAIIGTWRDGNIRSGGYTSIEELENGLDGMCLFSEGETKVALSWNSTYDRGEFDPSWCLVI
jgi:hypothetical protein